MGWMYELALIKRLDEVWMETKDRFSGMAEDKVKRMLEEIFLKAVKEVDTEASFQYYLINGKIKVIRKDNGDST